MNRDDVIDVLTVVAAATRRSVGEADVKIWSEIIGGDDKQLALKAVRDHLRDKPGVWLEPGHVHQRVREMVRDQLAREPREVQESRMRALEFKAAEDIADLAERKGIPSNVVELKVRRRGVAPELKVRCPWCKAAAGQPCVVPRTNTRLTKTRFHDARTQAARGSVNA